MTHGVINLCEKPVVNANHDESINKIGQAKNDGSGTINAIVPELPVNVVYQTE